MKNSKGVYVTKRDLKAYNRDYELYSSRIVRGEEDFGEDYEVYKDFSCQYNSKRDNNICTCKKANHRSLRYYTSPRQIYRTQERYPGWKSFTEIGVGSIKTLPKRRTRRIYLPETDDRGVGNSDYSLLFEQKKRRNETSYYDQKRTSSKCVGGIIETITASLISKKLSPIVQTVSCATSPIDLIIASKQQVKSTDTYKVNKNIVAQIEYSLTRDSIINQTVKAQKESKRDMLEDRIEVKPKPVKQTRLKTAETCTDKIEKDFSSDSLVQHVHNLENPSIDKQIRASIDPMENKLEREYRKMFATKEENSSTQQSIDKPVTDLKSASVLRRRFEALRRGLAKKEDSKKEIVTEKNSSQRSVLSRKDVSIASDPPSLEPKSYSNTKIYSPYTSFTNPYKYVNSTVVKKKRSPSKKQDISSNWSTDVVDSDCQGVKGMFKLWGKKFNFEDDTYKKPSPKTSVYASRKPEKKIEKGSPTKVGEEKKRAKKFFFFRKRSKDKAKQVFKTKKGVTAGRCEVEDGLTIKIGAKEYPTEIIQDSNIDSNLEEDYDNILKKSWLRTFLSSKVDSRRSVQIRWNNNMYATSSSTIFELLDCVYKNTGLVIRSKSDVTTGESSNYYSRHKHGPKFMQRNIEAWMIPTTIYPQYQTIDLIKTGVRKDKTRNIQVTYSDRKWCIDRSQRGNKLELVLHSKNFIKTGKHKSSEYILIDIPKGYFTESLTLNDVRSSDEEVYKITDYESPNSNTNYCQRNTDNFDMGDHVHNGAQVELSVKDINVKSPIIESLKKTPPLCRDVTIQGSQVYIPKLCDVIGVGIITQRDIRDIKKPILKTRDDMTDSESVPKLLPQKKCELAESYLQDYYRHWIPLGIDLFSWCISDTNLRCSSEYASRTTLNNQGDVSKSCPNIFEDFQTSNIVSSCNTSSCSHCYPFDEGKKHDKSKKEKSGLLDKLFNKSLTTEAIRVSPKDSLEVFRKRRMYACGNRSNWNTQPYSVPSCEDSCAQPYMSDSFKYLAKTKKSSKKHVSIPDCETMDCKQQSCVKVTMSGCETCKKSSVCQPPQCRTLSVVLSPPPCQTPPEIPPEKPPKASSHNIQSRKDSPRTSPTCLHSSCKSPHCVHSPPCDRCARTSSKSCKPLPHKLTPCTSPPCVPSSKKTSSTNTPQPPCKNNRCCSPHCVSPIQAVKSPSHTLPCKTPSSSQSTCQSPCASPTRRSTPRQTPPRKSPSCQSLLNAPPCRRHCCHCSHPTSPSNTPTCKSRPISSPKRTTKNSAESLQRLLPGTCSPCTKSRAQSPCKCCSQNSRCCSVSSIQKSGIKLQMAPLPNPPAKCNKNCPSNPIPKKKEKECSPNCANRRKLKTMQTPRAPPPTLKGPQSPSESIADKFLKHYASKKRVCSDQCSSGSTNLIPNTIRLSSNENITINLKKPTPSTEEIRESLNIKVQDEDGRTLYERVDYHKDPNKNEAGTCPDNTIIKKLYRDSHIHRVSTTTCVNEPVNNKNSENTRSCSSLGNLIEINFTLKFKHGDKTDEIDINNSGHTPKEEQATDARMDTLTDVYRVDDKQKKSIDNTNTEKNDVNISIFIKNCKQNEAKKPKKQVHVSSSTKQTDEFSKKISQKFHTVATGYSEFNLDNQAFSLHTINTDLNSSVKITKSNNESTPLLKAEECLLTASQSSAEHTFTENTYSSIKNDIDYENKTDVSEKYSKDDSFKNVLESNTDKSETGVSLTDDDKYVQNIPNKEQLFRDMKKLRSRKEKKEMLKKVFENAASVEKTKEAVKTVREMLHAILTSDSSGQEDHSDTGNDLIKELTRASLNKNYYRDTDSMNNYYNVDSVISEEKVHTDNDEEPIYPTMLNSNVCSDVDEKVENPRICMCNAMAAKLNLKSLEPNACCCRKRDQKDEEIHCELIKDSVGNIKKNCVGMQTHDCRKNIKQTVIATNVSTIVQINSKEREAPIAKIAPRSIQTCMMQEVSKRTSVHIDQDDKVVVLNKTSNKIVKNSKKYEANALANVLQSNETKKAVLEIYAEKILTSEGTHIVARLPKYVISRESKIYEVIEVSRDKVCKKNTLTMKIA
ncbi:uncharacterized protein LOC123703944 [Colias croceus]|uniref:uncharacterized protein LOC123703944 n=1 Tax=Colias crocea TaxID=72248 RepID=UPI001E27F6AB|nr:uncharacterized protein LOC123703944 [Colias croceus]